MNNKQQAMWEALSELSGEQVLQLFTDYHGTQILNDEFYEFLRDEGIM